MRNLHLSILSAIALAGFGLLALGSSNDNKGASGSAGPAATGASAGGDRGAVLATCDNKFSGKHLECTENYGMVPTMAEDLCKKDGGVFAKGATPCSKDGLTGTCEYKAKNPGEPGEIHYYYPGSVGDPKGSCEALGAVWTAAGAAPAGSGAPAKK